MFKTFDKKIDTLLSKMTLREKIGQLNQQVQPINAEKIAEIKEKIRNGEVGSIILAISSTAGNTDNNVMDLELFNELQRIAVEESRLGIPMIFGRDVIHGHRTVFPIALAASASFDPELVKECYTAIAKEAASNGVHWTFSPMIDICHDPRFGRIVEGCGEDPYLTCQMAKAMINGFQGEDISSPDSVAACAKHFLGYGASEGGRDYHRTEISDYTLNNYILPPFKAAVEAGVATVMSSFNDINGEPVTGSYYYLTEILKNRLGFDGFVVSDWAAVRQLCTQGVSVSNKESTKHAITAGLDMDMADGLYLENLQSLVQSGEISQKLIDEAVKRVLRIKFAKGLFSAPYFVEKQIDYKKHFALARKLAAESMVLLKNNGILPLNKEESVLLVGPFADEKRAILGTWTLDFNINDTKSLSDAMSVFLADKLVMGDGALSITKTKALEDIDTIVLALGESHQLTGEGKSLANITISKEQVELARAAHNIGKKVVGIIFSGRPLALENIEPYLDAILWASHCGTETANAVCDIIFGDISPSGKTPVTFVRASGQIPLYYNSTHPARNCNGYYGDSTYLDMSGSPMYPFGYGLSYTDFDISSIECEAKSLTLEDIQNDSKFRLSVTVKNMGNMVGKQTVQLYIHDTAASLMRPWRELKAFKKIELGVYEQKRLVFEIGKNELGYYMPNGEYVIEKGEFKIFIGGDSLTENHTVICIM